MANSKGPADLEMENALKTCNDLCVTSCQQMSEIWKEMFGNDRQVYKERMEAVKTHLENLFDDMLSEERETLNATEEKIISLMEERRTLEIELGVVIEMDQNELPRYQVKDNIDSCLKKFRDMRTQRLQDLENLKNKELTLCECLEFEPKYRHIEGVPSENLINEIRGYLDNLEATMIERFNKFCNVRLEVIKNLRLLKEDAETYFERLVVNTDVTLFKVTDLNMEELNQLQKNLRERIKSEKEIVADLRKNLNALWDILEYDDEYREAFMARCKGSGSDTSETLRDEISRCHFLKHSNIDVFIKRLGDQINELLVKCCLTKEQHRAFAEIRYPVISDQLYEARERELDRLINYYEKNEDLITMAVRRAELWEQMVALENAANQPERLFGNRGGQLLEEEKKRRRIQTQLPLLEKKLLNKISYYKKKNAEDFLYYGKPMAKLITQQWRERRMAIQARKLARRAQRAQTSAVVKKTPKSAGTRKKGPSSATPANKRGKITPPKTRSTQQESVSSLPNLRKKPQTDTGSSTSSTRRQIGLRKKVAETKPTPVSTLTRMATRSRLSNGMMQRRLLRDRNIPARIKLPITF